MPYKNPEDQKEHNRLYRLKHKDEIRAKEKQDRIDYPEKYLCKGAKQRAKRFQLEFNLEESDIVIPQMCPLLNIPISKKGIGPRTDNTPSLDRIDNSKGYIKGNVWVISWKANRIKANASIEELEKIVLAIESKLIK